MNLQIIPHKLSGSVTPPPSKSMAHRLIIAAALSCGSSTVENISFSEDISATLRCIEALGATWTQTAPGVLQITGLGGKTWAGDLPRFDCGESGSTLRFFIPIALAIAGGGIFTGQGRLMQRPQQPYFDLFAEHGISYTQNGNTLTVKGRLSPGKYRLPGNVSSQFFTGLLFALPLLDGPSTLTSTTALESADYIRMTIDALQTAGVSVSHAADALHFVLQPAAFRPFHTSVESDWSQAAFWFAANFLDSQLDIQGLNPQSTQGDMAVFTHYWQLARPGDTEIDVSGCPDLLPPLAVMAAVRTGSTRFSNAARLRLKESDRLTSVHQLLTALGVRTEEKPDQLIVYGATSLQGGAVDGCGDHRIIMAAAIAATACSSPVTLLGADAVAKSYPDFFEVYRSLGGEFHDI